MLMKKVYAWLFESCYSDICWHALAESKYLPITIIDNGFLMKNPKETAYMQKLLDRLSS